MQRKLIQTEDGSSSLYIPELDENYHSIHGAIQESMHVFIEAGLKKVKKDRFSVFEMGYGTGLNMLLTFLNARNKEVDYYGIEAFPLEVELLDKLNYAAKLNLTDEEKGAFNKFHELESEGELSANFRVRKQQCKLHGYVPATKVDLIYFDAFAPEVQPNLWEADVFEKMYSMLNAEGILTTYCAKGVVRRTMQSVGFKVERIPGPPGKREMLRAIKLHA